MQAWVCQFAGNLSADEYETSTALLQFTLFEIIYEGVLSFSGSCIFTKICFWNFYGNEKVFWWNKDKQMKMWAESSFRNSFLIVAIAAYKIAYKTYSTYQWSQYLISDVSNFLMFGENSTHFWKNFGLKFDVHAQCSGVEKNTFWNYFLQALKPLQH